MWETVWTCHSLLSQGAHQIYLRTIWYSLLTEFNAYLFNASLSHNLIYSFHQCRTVVCLPIGHIVSFLGNNIKNLLYILQSRTVAYNQSVFPFFLKRASKDVYLYMHVNLTQFHEHFVKQWVAKKGKKYLEKHIPFDISLIFFFFLQWNR